MQDELFHSSDSFRTAKPLPYARVCELDEPLKLERGGLLSGVRVVYETYGELDAERSNAVLICHALSGDSHVARHDEHDDPGWWDIFVGPGKPIDTNRYFVICPNILGGCRGTTGPMSVNPATGKPYGSDFPVITVGDMVETQKRLLDKLGIQRLLAVVGGSLGGHMVLEWARRFPQRLAGAVAIATSPRLTSQALAFDIVGRNAILTDPAYQSGQYYNSTEKPVDGLAIARMLGHITYLSREAMMRKFDPKRLEPRELKTDFETRFAVGSYLAYQGGKFVERFDANSYIVLTLAMDLFDLGGTTAELTASLAPSQCRWLVLSFTSDWLFPPFQSQQIVDALIRLGKPVSYCNVKSACGHDAFLLPDDLPVYGELVKSFLSNLNGTTQTPRQSRGLEEMHSPASIFHEQRLDYDTIMELIPPGASVLDLGCGSGGLLARLRQRGHRRIMGLELDQTAILACLAQGLDVVQKDLNAGLDAFEDGQFDVVVLSQTLQTIMAVDRVLKDVLRVGRRCIVSFPNFAYHKLRTMLSRDGRAPRAGAWLSYDWHNTPNVRFFSIADFEDFCEARSIRILQQIALNTELQSQVHDDPNLNADVAVVVIGR